MARKPSASHRGSRTPGQSSPSGRARGANHTNHGEAGRTRASPGEKSPGQSPASTTGRSSRAPAQPDSAIDLENLRAGGRDGASEQRENPSRDRSGGTGATETSSERQGMGRGHRRNFDESDDDATTRGPSAADATSEARDSGIDQRSRATGDSAPRRSPSSRGGRPSSRRSDW
jgi:hypothetical protein